MLISKNNIAAGDIAVFKVVTEDVVSWNPVLLSADAMDDVHKLTVLWIFHRHIQQQIRSFVEIDRSFHVIVVEGF